MEVQILEEPSPELLQQSLGKSISKFRLYINLFPQKPDERKITRKSLYSKVMVPTWSPIPSMGYEKNPPYEQKVRSVSTLEGEGSSQVSYRTVRLTVYTLFTDLFKSSRDRERILRQTEVRRERGKRRNVIHRTRKCPPRPISVEKDSDLSTQTSYYLHSFFTFPGVPGRCQRLWTR